MQTTIIAKEEIVSLFRDITEDTKYTYETFIWEAGLNSIQAVYIISKIYNQYHLKIELKDMLSCCRIQDVYALLQTKNNQ